MKQLILTPKQLLSIGFTKKVYPAVKQTEETPFGRKRQIVYQIPCVNGYFYFNFKEEIHVWYQVIKIEDGANFICLNIVSKPELFTILSAFNVKFNLDLS